MHPCASVALFSRIVEDNKKTQGNIFLGTCGGHVVTNDFFITSESKARNKKIAETENKKKCRIESENIEQEAMKIEKMYQHIEMYIYPKLGLGISCEI